MKTDECMSVYLDFLEHMTHHHPCEAPLYGPLKAAIRKDMLKIFGAQGTQEALLEGFGNLRMPFFQMGSIDSVNLFDIDELIIFAFYRRNAVRFRNVLDIGANIGLHSILLAKLGMRVHCYEPDPIHFDRLVANAELNGVVSSLRPIKAAVSNAAGKAEFIRVLGNTTGSHLAGAKSNPYGELERFGVDVVDFRTILTDIDLIKLDAEGEEARILLTTNQQDWAAMDAIVEVGNESNAQQLFDHFQTLGVNLFAQKVAWIKVESIEQMPVSYREGSLFISSKPSMPWD